MKSRQKNKQQGKHKVAPPTKRRYTWWVIGALVVLVTTIFMLWPDPTLTTTETQPPSSPPAVQENVQGRQDMLVGRWLRSDGGYAIDIRGATADGKLDAGYFNPNPIHVSRAEWLLQGGKLTVLVELRDVNYPGSTYTLEFLEREGRMVGTYYQAVERVSYDVAFTRE